MKKIRDRLGISHENAKKRGAIPRRHSRPDDRETEAANVRYFLHALNQMSLALHALGYVTEGDSLVKVKIDLNNRLFNSSGKMTEIARLLH